MLLIGPFGGMLVLMMLRVAMPFGVRIDGQPVGRTTLSLGERVRLQRTNVYAIGGFMLLVAASGGLPLLAEMVVMAAVAAILSIPARYILTDAGIALNHVVFRPWSEFTHFVVEPGGVRLEPRTGVRPFKLVLAPAKAQSLIPVLKRFLPARAPASAGRGIGRRTLGVRRA